MADAVEPPGFFCATAAPPSAPLLWVAHRAGEGRARGACAGQMREFRPLAVHASHPPARGAPGTACAPPPLAAGTLARAAGNARRG